jgi:hypothetical protein
LYQEKSGNPDQVENGAKVFFFSLKCPRYVDSAIILEQTASF